MTIETAGTTQHRETSGTTAIAVDRASRRFQSRSGTVEALAEITLSVSGEVVGLVGPSGCGKSTLLELICGLQQPDGGSIAIDGTTDPAARLEACALMFQRDLLFPWRSALDNAALALELRGVGRAQAREQAHALLVEFGLEGFERARPHELSGGMRQRVAFVRTLLTGKPVMLLDEPFGALDTITRARMQEWIVTALAQRPRTVVLVTHDVEEALYLCDRVLILSERPGRVRAELPVPRPRALPRAEAVTSPDFTTLRAHALEALS